MAYALNDLRNKAADMGANYVSYGQPQLGTSGTSEHVTTTTATVVGTAYSCPTGADTPERGGAEVGRAMDEAPEVEPQLRPKAPKPTGAGGFEFGQSAEEGERACTQSGNEWRAREREGYFGCSGTPRSVGLNATVLVKYCANKLCWIRFNGKPNSDGAWRETFARLLRSLEDRYGRPEFREILLPRTCRHHLEACLRDGAASAEVQWDWEGRSVQLIMGKAPGDPDIRLIYKTKFNPLTPNAL